MAANVHRMRSLIAVLMVATTLAGARPAAAVDPIGIIQISVSGPFYVPANVPTEFTFVVNYAGALPGAGQYLSVLLDGYEVGTLITGPSGQEPFDVTVPPGIHTVSGSVLAETYKGSKGVIGVEDGR